MTFAPGTYEYLRNHRKMLHHKQKIAHSELEEAASAQDRAQLAYEASQTAENRDAAWRAHEWLRETQPGGRMSG